MLSQTQRAPSLTHRVRLSCQLDTQTRQGPNKTAASQARLNPTHVSANGNQQHTHRKHKTQPPARVSECQRSAGRGAGPWGFCSQHTRSEPRFRLGLEAGGQRQTEKTEPRRRRREADSSGTTTRPARAERTASPGPASTEHMRRSQQGSPIPRRRGGGRTVLLGDIHLGRSRPAGGRRVAAVSSVRAESRPEVPAGRRGAR